MSENTGRQTLGSRLRGQFEAQGKQQKEIALAWLDRMEETKKPKIDTVLSHMSRLLNDKSEAVQFFFKAPRRAALLFELLNIPDVERATLHRLAEEAMKEDARQPVRLVIDATPWAGKKTDSEALFEALKEHLAKVRVLGPVALVIREKQYDWLPRSFDKESDLQVEQVADDQDAWARVHTLADNSALVMSSRRYEALERWLAADLVGDKLTLEPADGLDLFYRGRQLPALSTVHHDAGAITKAEGLREALVPSSAVRLRRLLIALGDETQAANLKLSPGQRLALALKLGVSATSLKEERIEAELTSLIAKLGVKPTSSDDTELQRILARAARRPVGPHALLISQTLHLINPDDQVSKLAELEHPRLKVHHQTCAEPALTRLTTVLKDYTTDDLEADRGLCRLLQRLDPERLQRAALLHARATLMWSGLVEVGKSLAPLDDWRTSLGKLLAEAPPPATLRLWIDAQETTPCSRQEWSVKPFLMTQREVGEWMACANIGLQKDDPIWPVIWRCPSDEPTLLDRRDKLWTIDYNTCLDARDYSYRRSSHHERHFLESNQDPSMFLTPQAFTATDVNLWMDLTERSHAVVGKNLDPIASVRLNQDHQSNLGRPLRTIAMIDSAVSVDEAIYPQADQELALCWLALRDALQQPQAIRQHDGQVYLSLGGGLFASISLRRCRSASAESKAEQEVYASFDATVTKKAFKVIEGHHEKTEERWVAEVDRKNLVTHRATTTGHGDDDDAHTSIGMDLPASLHIAGFGLRADVSFLHSPFFWTTSGGRGGPPSILASAGAQILHEQHQNDRREEEDRLAADYDDGDDNE